VVRTLDVDATMVDDKQVNYMVMEYVEGKSLRELIHDLTTVPETLLREVALQMAAGVAAIHSSGIVHRDLKPENVLITGDHRIRIMDLGVAKLQEASVALTKEGQFAGSFLYAAPEQFGGAPVGPAADLYSLGVVLYELATGQNPFRRDDAAAVIQAHLAFAPPRASELIPELSSFLCEVLVHLMKKKPAERIGSAEHLRQLMEEGEESEWWAAREQHLRKKERRLPKIRVRRETALHGRDAELRHLRDAWERAKGGKGNTLLVEGEAGVGKTRLMDAFLGDVGDEDVHVLYGSYPPSGGMGGLSDAVMGKFGTTGLDGVLAPYLGETPSLVPAFVALIRHEAAPSGSEPLQGDALHAVCCNLVQALAAEKPTIWVVDELHFAPAESRKLVLSLARAVEDHRILLLVTSRPGLPEEDLAHFNRLDTFRRMQLTRLSPREVIELVRDALKSEVLADRLGAKIAYKSDGIPFFVFEIIRGLKEARFLDQSPDGTYVETRPISEIEVPSAVKDLIEARLRDLAQEERAILDVGAVQGYEFDADLVARVREAKRVQVLETLAAIERRSGVVRASGRKYTFDHPQIQEVLSAGLSEVLREEYHSMLADGFAARERITDSEGVEGESAFFLAWHGLHGSEPERGLPYLKAALAHLQDAWQSDRAVQLASRALSIPRLLVGEARVEVLLSKSTALAPTGRRDEQRLVLEEAVQAADASGDAAVRASAHNALGSVLWQTAQYGKALGQHETALELSRAARDRALEAKALSCIGVVCWSTGRLEEARTMFESVLPIAEEAGDQRLTLSSVGNLGVVCRASGRLAESLHLKERALGLAEARGHRRTLATVSGNLADDLCHAGRYEEAIARAERALSIYREIGDRTQMADASTTLGTALAAIGRRDRWRETLARASEFARMVGDQRGEGYALHALGEASELYGDVSEAESAHTDALALRREIKYPKGLAETLVAIGRLHLAHGNPEKAREELDEALRVATEMGALRSITLATTYRSLLPGGEPSAAALEEHDGALGAPDRMKARFALFRATGDEAHIEAAKGLLDGLRDHAPEESRESMIANVPLYREILEAWRDR